MARAGDIAKQEKAWLTKYLAPLKGATITAVKVKAEREDGWVDHWPTLTVRTASGETYELEVSQDEEGNGPGFIFGLPTPEQVPA